MSFLTLSIGFLGNLTTQLPADATSMVLPVSVEYIACIVAAMFGAAVAYDRQLDIVGAVFLALLTAFGGGLLRDMMIPGANVYFLDTPGAVISSIIAGLLVFYFRTIFNHISSPMFWLDIISVALFAFLGAEKGLLYGCNPFACIMLGTITAIGGGFLRDASTGNTPQIFKPSNFYGIAALAGAIVYIVLTELHVVKVIGMFACVAVTMLLRYLSVKLNWRTTTSVDYSRYVLTPIKRIMHFPDGSQTVDTQRAHDLEELAEITEPSKLIVIDKNSLIVVSDVDGFYDKDAPSSHS